MRILGIDPGYAILGWGILDLKGNKFSVVDYGAVTTDSKMEMPLRLQHIYTELSAIIEEYRPDEAAIEELFFNNNAKTAIMVGHSGVRGWRTFHKRVYASSDKTGPRRLRQGR